MSGLEEHTRPILGGIVVLSFAVFCGVLVYIPHTPGVDATIIGIILGALGSNATSVIQFYFGNSAGKESADKTISASLASAQNGVSTKVDQIATAVGTPKPMG